MEGWTDGLDGKEWKRLKTVIASTLCDNYKVIVFHLYGYIANSQALGTLRSVLFPPKSCIF